MGYIRIVVQSQNQIVNLNTTMDFSEFSEKVEEGKVFNAPYEDFSQCRVDPEKVLTWYKKEGIPVFEH